MINNLTRHAAEQQRRFDAITAPRARKEQGHFGTAPAIADFMAGMFTEIPQAPCRVLDPGAGVGTLSAALCQRVLQQRTPCRLAFDLWENNPHLEVHLHSTMETCRKVLKDAGHEMAFRIQIGDFVLEHAQPPPLFAKSPAALFDLVIMNPPYFKVRKDSKIAQAMGQIVYGQPNIYAFFMAIAADLLRDGGEMVAITPRSYFNGPYFKRFRKWFFDRMAIRRIHIFESRTQAFQEDEVLQENVILMAEKATDLQQVVLSSSTGRDFQKVARQTLPYGKVIEQSSGERFIRVATSGFEQRIIEIVDNLPHRFRELPFRISTGPVVTFRSTEFLRRERLDNTAPLFWMHNILPFEMRFPRKHGKPSHILICDDSNRLLLPAKRYVLLKRFTAKEEPRRLVAGILEAQDSYAPFVGLENHLNYICEPSGELSKAEALGLAALFNSILVDRYFRAISGNTQVNAAEIRAMPVPCLETIRKLGLVVEKNNDRTPVTVERIVGEVLGIPNELIEELCGAS